MDAVATPHVSAEEFIAKYEGESGELVRGRVVEVATGSLLKGFVRANLGSSLVRFVDDRDLGRISGADSFVKIPNVLTTIRGADICFYDYERMRRDELIPNELSDHIPNLVFELISADDRWGLLVKKIADYLQSGVTVVGVVDTESISVSLHRAGKIPEIIELGDVLTVPDLLPGWFVEVRELFE